MHEKTEKEWFQHMQIYTTIKIALYKLYNSLCDGSRLFSKANLGQLYMHPKEDGK